MKIKIAVFGREELVGRVIEHIKEQDDDEIDIVPFTFTHAQKTVELIEQAVMCDVYLFTTPLSFLYAREKITKKRLPAVTIPYDEYMILTAFYRLQNTHDKQIKEFSIDTPAKRPVDEVSNELTIQDHSIYTYRYGGNQDWNIDSITAHHRTLWAEGKIKYVLTSINEVEERLRLQNIPVYPMNIPKSNIEQAIDHARKIAAFHQSKGMQIVTGLIRIKQYDELAAEFGQKLADERMDELQQLLHQFADRTNSSILADDNQIALIGTQDVLHYLKNHLRDLPLLKDIEQKLEMTIDMGFGLGLTAKQAENNAVLALKQCTNTFTSACYILNERQETIGPLGVEKHIDTSQLYRALIHKAKLNNELSYNFIDFIKLRNNEPFSANDIANFYRVTKRSAERTVYKLLTGKVIEVVGEEKPYQRGRPRKLFKITL